jgi:formylglycine-generating enzyme required for sulfatase activity
MTVVPAGTGLMGSSGDEIIAMVREYGFWFENETPQHEVTFERPFAIARFEATWAEWDVCVAAGACDGTTPQEAFAQTGQIKEGMPVTFVSWEDAQAYAAWLTAHTGQDYHLTGEAEWEYAARAGTTTPYWWGDRPSPDRANIGAPRDQCCKGYTKGADIWFDTAPVGSFPTNPFGLHDTSGNVLEWTRDCSNWSYERSPRDGSAWEKGDCYFRMQRGGSYLQPGEHQRSAWRKGAISTYRFIDVGFRVARDL